MTIVDTDVFTDILKDRPATLALLSQIPQDEQSISIITAEEIIRGQLASIRSAESTKNSQKIVVAYRFFHQQLRDLARYRILPCNEVALMHFQSLQAAKIRIGTQDLRIASIALAHDAKLVSRNRRDYELVPNLNLEIWN